MGAVVVFRVQESVVAGVHILQAVEGVPVRAVHSPVSFHMVVLLTFFSVEKRTYLESEN